MIAAIPRSKPSHLRGPLLLLLAIAGLLTGPTSALADPPRTLAPYVAFADQRMTIHGKDDPGGGHLNSGSIGVNGLLAFPNDEELTLLAKITAAPGTNIVANDMQINDASSIWNVYANSVNNSFQANGTYNSISTFTTPVLQDAVPQVQRNSTFNQSLPALPDFTPSGDPGDDIDVPINGAVDMTGGPGSQGGPGVYRNLILRNGSTIKLGDGTYVFADVSQQGNRATIETTDKTIVQVAQTFHLGINNQIIGSDLARFEVRGDGVAPFTIGQDGLAARAVFFNDTPDNNDADPNNDKEFRGQFLVPYHWMTLGNHNRMFGRFWAKGIHSDLNPDWNLRAPESVSGKKFSDDNGNGQQDGNEAPLAGFTFYLDLDDDGQFGMGEPSAVSDANGEWKIGPLNLIGNYKVREVQQPGYTCTFPANCMYTIDLETTGDTHGGNDFGNKPANSPCEPKPGEDANCQPVVKCVPTAGQDANCQPIVTPLCVPKAGQDRNCNPLVVSLARLTGPTGCVTSSSVRVSGSNVKQVTFTYNGKKRVVKKSPFRITIKKNQLKRGANRVVAKVVFRDGKRQISGLTVQRCGSSAVSPQFTG